MSGDAFPSPVPLGVRLGNFTHGDAVTFPEALELAGRPDFPEHWAIVPDESGSGLRLMWGTPAPPPSLSGPAPGTWKRWRT